MVSQNRKDDKEFILEIGDTIQMLVKMGTKKAHDLAELWGEEYLKLEHKIQTHDYTSDDYRSYGIINRQKDEEKLNENK